MPVLYIMLDVLVSLYNNSEYNNSSMSEIIKLIAFLITKDRYVWARNNKITNINANRY